MLTRLMDKALSVADEGETIMINLMAAKDKEPFYEKLGFRPTSEEFLEDGIPHIKMTLK